MTHKMSPLVVVLLSCLILGCEAGEDGKQVLQARDQSKTNPDAQLLKDFNTRIEAYMDLHKKARKEAPALKETRDAAKIQESQDALAAKIREARSEAKPGDIFTPETRQLFRRLMYPELKGEEGAATKESLKEDAPKGVPLKVNATYPETAALATMPPNLLAALPALPEELEYRVVNRDLILRDVHANLILDYIPNAIR